MASLHSRMEEFIYGRVCEPADSAAGRSISDGLRKHVRTVLNRSAMVAMSVLVASTTILGESAEITVSGLSATQIANSEVLAGVSPVELRVAFKKRRQYLGLSQDRTARFLQVSPSSVEKYEQGAVKAPSYEHMERYLALIDLARLYQSEFGNRKYLVKAALEGHSPYYGGKSAFDFAAESVDGIFKILGSERRKYA